MSKFNDLSKIPPSTTALRAFEAASRHLSFTTAAAELQQTQSAISHQIRQLETRLEVSLFERKAHGIALTTAGRRYLPFVREALSQLQAGVAALRPSVDDHVLTVSCSPNFAQKWLVPRLGDFMATHPDIELRISATPQHITFDNDGVDMAVRHGNGDWPHLDITQLCQEQVFPVCGPHLMPSIKLPLSIHELSDYVLIHDQTRTAWAHWLENHQADITLFDLDSGAVFSQTSLAIDAAIAGQGIALARSALAQLDLQAGRLVRPVAEVFAAEFAYWIVCPKHYASKLKVQRFRQWLLRSVIA